MENRTSMSNLQILRFGIHNAPDKDARIQIWNAILFMPIIWLKCQKDAIIEGLSN
jgi:hypothetical protein